MEVNELEQGNIKSVKKRIAGYRIINCVLLLLMIADLVIGFVFQTRETKTTFIVVCSLVLFILLVVTSYICFSFLNPTKKYLSLLLREKNLMHIDIIRFVKEEKRSYEDGFETRTLYFVLDNEEKPIRLKMNAAIDFEFIVDKEYEASIYSDFIFACKEKSYE